MAINYGFNNVFTSGNIDVSGIITGISGVFSNINISGSSFNNAVSGLLPTIANSGDNRILTSTGSSVGINAESNLTFDGNLLNVTGSGSFSSNLRLNGQTANTIAGFDASKNITSLNTSTYPNLTELSYVKDVTSAIQTQLNNKAALVHTHVVNDITNFASGVADEVSTTITAGTGINLNYDSGTDTLTIDVSGLINNPSDNRILTSRDSSGSLIDAESDLTFSDGILTVGGPNNATVSQIHVYNNNAGDNTTSLRLFNTNADIMISIDSNDDTDNNEIHSYEYPLWIYSLGGQLNLFTYTTLDINAASGTSVSNGNFKINNQTANTIASFDGSKNVVSLSTGTYPSLTELSYVKGVTSALQTQINSKQNTLTNPVTGTGISSHIAYWNSNSGLAADSGRLYWDATNDRLGIGMASPETMLHVFNPTSSSSISEVARFGVSGIYDGNFRFFIGSTSDRGGELRYYEGNTEYSRVNFDVNRIDFITRGAYPINFLTNNNGNEGHNLRMTVTSAGNVGIGNSSPSYRLDVSGSGNFSAVFENGNRLKNRTLAYFTALDNQPPASGFATLDTRNSIAVLDFDDTVSESGVFVGIMPENASLASGIDVRLHWIATTGTTGICRWGVQFEEMISDLDIDSFDTTVAEGGSTTNATNGVPTVTEIRCTGIDSITAGDLFRILVYRDATDTVNDTLSGDAELLAIELRSVL